MKKIIFIIILIVTTYFMFSRDYDLDHLDPGIGKTIIDTHVHVAGLGYGDSGCFVNREMQDNFRFPVYLWAMNVSENELVEQGDQVLISRLSESLSHSKSVKQAVVLALDGYVDTSGENAGELNKTKTQVYVPNEYLAKETSRYDNLLFGASIHPGRKDALARLRKVKQQGAVLVKWIPSIMNIDPSNKQYKEFYELMAELKIPLLSHTGMEKSFSHAIDEYADPLRLKFPLELGVTVIAAHIATTGKNEGQDNFDRIIPMLHKYPNLYVDISSLTQLNKLNYLSRALEDDVIISKMIYGTDWPLQFFPLMSPWYHINHISINDAFHVGGIRNQWDRDVALKKALKVPDDVFKRSVIDLIE
ncbi:MAG: amidohydrolase family protein [Woeseiaceae bacterium]